MNAAIRLGRAVALVMVVIIVASFVTASAASAASPRSGDRSIVLAVPVGVIGVSFTVDDTTDAVDADLTDGICRTITGTCSLRAAIQQANASTGTEDTVVLADGGIYTLTILDGGLDEAFAASGDLDIRDDLVITVANSGRATIAGGPGWDDRIFELPFASGATSVRLIGLTI